jgi:hypothetical protein
LTVLNFSFVGTEAGNQGFALAKQSALPLEPYPLPFFAFRYFSGRVSHFHLEV